MALDPGAAATEAARAAISGLGDRAVEAALILATAACGSDAIPRLVEETREALGCDAVAGASVEGVLACGREVERNPALLVVALADADVRPFFFEELPGDEEHVGTEIAALVNGAPRAGDLVVVLSDSHGVRTEPLLEGLASALGPATVVGAGAAEVGGGSALAWGGSGVARDAVAGLVLRRDAAPRVGIAPAHRRVYGPATVTRAQGHWILELDDRRALDVYLEIAGEPLAADLRYTARRLLLGLPAHGDPDCRGPVRARHAVGFDPSRGALSIPERVAPGDRVTLELCDALAAREELSSLLEEASTSVPPPDLTLYFNCRARGEALFGVSGIEIGYLERAFAKSQVAGIYAPFQIAPLAAGQRPQLLTHAGVVALI